MPKTPPLDKVKALRRVEGELQKQDVAGTLIPGDAPVSIPGDFVKVLRREFPERSTSWHYETAAAIGKQSWVKTQAGVVYTMASSGTNYADKIQPEQQAARREELKPLRQQWGRDGGRPTRVAVSIPVSNLP